MCKIYLFIGQPGSGKTTLANLLKTHLDSERIIHIDGDDIREIFNNKNYSEEGRRLNVQRAYDIATFLNKSLSNNKYTVIISLVSPFIDQREILKQNKNVIEIYVHTTDMRGKEHYHVDYFQKPIENFIDIDTTQKTEIKSLEEIISNDLFLY